MDVFEEVINNRFVTCANIPITYNKQEANVKIHRMAFGKMNSINQIANKVTYVGGQPRIDFNQELANEQTLLKGILNAPFPITLEEIRELDAELAKNILTAITELNTPTDKKKETLATD